MSIAHINGIDLWYELTSPPGRPDAPMVVLTHGFAGPWWPPVVDEFRARYRLLWYHVRGHGRSSVPDDPAAYSVPTFAADLAGLLDTLHIERAHIGGVSMGGIITAQFACDHPERMRCLLLCDTVCGNAHDGAADGEARRVEGVVRRAFTRQAEIVERHGLGELVVRENRYRREHDAYAKTRRESQEEQDAENARKLELMTPRGYISVGGALSERPDLVPRLPSVAAPALVSCGEWDLFYPCAERDAALLPNARFATIRRAAHSTPAYQPQLWKQAVFDFIDDVEAGRDVRGTREYAPGEE
jgi:pimeloyl-ACP methyl ester carboxylesterase